MWGMNDDCGGTTTDSYNKVCPQFPETVGPDR